MSATASFRTLDDWLPWLESLSPREIVLGLDRVEAVLERLGIERPGLVVTIAGTNGKGSSLAIIESILRHQGRKTGAYSSPHVYRYNERTRIDGKAATDAVVLDALQTVEDVRGDIPLTFFEFGTLATLVAFDRAGADTWLLEVGMGGRLDAVNVIDADACLITNVALDHCSWLGHDVETIAVEKAGVMRRSRPAIFGAPTMPDSIRRVAGETGADLIRAGEDFNFQVEADGSWTWRGREKTLEGLPRPGLPGDIQYQNASAVLAVIEALEIDDVFERTGLADALTGVELDGRCQPVGDNWLLDVAHNPAAAEVLACELEKRYPARRITAVVGMLDDKDVEGFIAPQLTAIDRFIATSIDGSRGSSAVELGKRIANASGKPCQILPELDEALAAAAADSGDDGLVLVTGSFYLVGPALDWIESRSGKPAAAEMTD